MKKRILSVLLSTAMVATLLVGCGQSAAPAESSDAAASEEAAPAKEEAAPAAEEETSDEEAEIYMFISSPEYADAINELIDAYGEVAPNVTINYETTQNDYPTLLKAKLNSGEVPDIFSSTSGKEIDVYKEWSYDMTGEALESTIDPAVAAMMKSPETGDGLYGIAIKGNYFGIVYNKAIFEEVGIASFPKTMDELKTACEKISAAGYKPFTTGFAEWWVFKHCGQTFVNAAAREAGITSAELVSSIVKGEKTVADYPILMNNWFDFIDLAVKYGDDKPLETALANEEAALANGECAMTLGQGAWIEGDVMSINPDFKLGFAAYPVSDNPADAKIIAGSDQALRVNKDSAQLKATMDFINWWYTSDYGKAWFNDVAGVVPPILSDSESEFEVIKQGSALSATDGAGDLNICYSTDSFHQTFGELMQAYIAGTATREATAQAITEQWAAIEGAN